jgi:hypothetical protein
MKDYLHPESELTWTPPDSCDFSGPCLQGLQDILANDTLGDCTCAGYGHVLDVLIGNAGGNQMVTKDQVIALYSAATGYNPDDPNTDQGADEQTLLDWLKTNPALDGSTLYGYVGLDASNPTEIKQAISMFKNCYFGVELPAEWTNPMPEAPGFVWDVAGDADPNEGHCFIGYGYTDQGVLIDTWGMVPGSIITWAAIAKYCAADSGGMLYVLLNQDIINKASQLDPDKLDWSQLIADFQSLQAAQS